MPNWGDEGKRDTNGARSVTISGVCARSVQIDFDDLVTCHAGQHLFDMARSSDKRPFFLQVSYTHPHEPSLRVPLIMKIPGKAPGVMQTPASLVDLLPTFMGLATGAGWSSEIEELDGMDLTGLADENTERPIFAEYLAEATTAPIFMIRRGQWKFICSRNDPTLLFDLTADPDELTNLADHPAHRDIVAQFSEMAEAKWDNDRLSRDIRRSQKRRRLVIEGLAKGTKPRWNHDETPDSKVEWYRGEGGYNEWAFKYLPPPETGDGPPG